LRQLRKSTINETPTKRSELWTNHCRRRRKP